MSVKDGRLPSSVSPGIDKLIDILICLFSVDIILLQGYIMINCNDLLKIVTKADHWNKAVKNWSNQWIIDNIGGST